MAATPLPPECMLPAELAKRMGKSVEWVCNELRKDSMREVRLYPFAIATRNEKTGAWSYRIFRKRYEVWESGTDINMDYWAGLIAAKVVEQLR